LYEYNIRRIGKEKGMSNIKGKEKLMPAPRIDLALTNAKCPALST
jgi:hypothetical protein